MNAPGGSEPALPAGDREAAVADRTLPGEVNAHTHLYSGLAALGMPAPPRAPSDFSEILSLVWWRLDRALDERSLRAAARYHVAQALRHGTTTLIDHHESPGWIEGSLDVLADACEELGMRAALCYGATERNGGRDEARRGLSECERFARENRRANVRALVGLHASFTVSDETVREAGALCARLGAPLHIHMAEDRCDVTDAQRRGYDGPLERLVQLGALPAGSVLAHGVHLTAGQVRLAGGRGCWLVQNPRSNHGNRVGYPRALDHSSRVALGTDGYESDMQEELAFLEGLSGASAQGDGQAREAGSAQRRLAEGRELAAALFGRSFTTCPDEITVRELGGHEARNEGPDASRGEARNEGPDAGAGETRNDPPGAGARARRREVRRVVIAGRAVVDQGRLLTGDWAEIDAQAREEARALWRRMEQVPWPA